MPPSQIKQQLRKGLEQLSAHLDAEESRLAAEQNALDERAKKMAEDHSRLRDKLNEDRARFEEEKKAVASTNKAASTKIKLDVGGFNYASSRTTLTSVPGSMLDAMFSGRHVLEEDEDGRIFIDRDGSIFKLILEYLRCPMTFTLEGLSKREVTACLAEFEYYGLPSPVPAAQPLSLRMIASPNGRTSVEYSDDRCTVKNVHGGNGWSYAVGAEALANDAVWKVTLGGMGGRMDGMGGEIDVSYYMHMQYGGGGGGGRGSSINLMMGIIANATPSQNNACQDPTFAGWANSGHVIAAGTQRTSQWPGWQVGDEAIFGLNESAKTLSVHLKRTGQVYKFAQLPTKSGQWRMCINMHGGTTQTVVISSPTAEDQALVK